jgi:hypothetical protein
MGINMAKKFVLAGAIALMPTFAFAATDLKGEIVNATEHADYAVASASIDDVHMHLHHALNCIVGPNGAGFDAKQMNPCANSGNGIIPDSTNGANKMALEGAAAKARDGIASTDMTTAKADATAVANSLKALK